MKLIIFCSISNDQKKNLLLLRRDVSNLVHLKKEVTNLLDIFFFQYQHLHWVGLGQEWKSVKNEAAQ